MIHVLNAITTSRANGHVERQNLTIIRAIRASTACESQWDEKLSDTVWGNESLYECQHWILPSTLMISHSSGTVADREMVHSNQMWWEEESTLKT